MNDVGALFARVPEGWSLVDYAGRRYAVTRTVHAGGRSESVLAEELGGTDLVSANLYRLDGEDVLKPCEMPSEKVLDFLEGSVPAGGAREQRSDGRDTRRGGAQHRLPHPDHVTGSEQ